MGRCIYCERPAGFMRKRHAECYERHNRALSMIPELFTKALHSSLPATRFGEMLKEAAGASFIRPRRLGKLCVSGISSMIDTVLKERLLTRAEEERIAEIKEALGPGIANVSDLNEKMIKIDMLREINEGRLPDRVTVVGPMPIELRRHEHVIWIFNCVVCYRARAPITAPEKPAIVFPATNTDLYCGMAVLKDDPLPTANLTEEATGDLVVTNRNVYFIFGDGSRRIPMAKITALHPYSDGITITCEQPQNRSRAFKLDDPWLAANLVVGLVRLVQNNSSELPETTD
jgi:hypothetical protein